MPDPARWDAGQYLRYAGDRARPFADLLARVRVERPASVVDLGCGPGHLTATLARRWPDAWVTGVDSSAEMIEAAGQVAAEHGAGSRLRFVLADLREWEPPGGADVVVSNAALHWVPGHLGLLPRLAGWLRPGGALAFGVPDNFAEPSHTEIAALCRSPRWRGRLAGAAEGAAAVEPVRAYLDTLAAAGLRVDAWETTYQHVLAGDDPVLQWVKGTALRPVLALLDEAEGAAFCAELGARLRAAYPPAPYGTVFPFRRLFVVAHRP